MTQPQEFVVTDFDAIAEVVDFAKSVYELEGDLDVALAVAANRYSLTVDDIKRIWFVDILRRAGAYADGGE